ncbi:MAG TPA: undecaprenyl-diphosphate phosphatase, partial [Ilumatobacteraceae bacterium]|nr:undecaprenyl-diphosphate phosphatase [Ilumatobacteraceae bacterium]
VGMGAEKNADAMASIEKAFDVALHLGTLIAVFGYFWRDLSKYVTQGLKLVISRQKPVDPDGRIAWLFVLSALPAAAVGAVAEDVIDEKLGTPGLIATSLVVFGLLLLWADQRRGKRTVEDLQTPDALKIGFAQIIALNPGTSRSGITMTAARLLGFSRDAAARISFLMAVPVTSGAVALKLAKLAKDGVPEGLMTPMIAGVLTAAISGWIAVWGTLRLVRTRSFAPFVIYRIELAVLVFSLIIARQR